MDTVESLAKEMAAAWTECSASVDPNLAPMYEREIKREIASDVVIDHYSFDWTCIVFAPFRERHDALVKRERTKRMMDAEFASSKHERGYGAEWIETNLRYAKKKITMSEFGAQVADLLNEVFSGIYHLETPALMRAEWDSTHYIRVATFQELASWDYNYLTRLVVLAHDRCIRVSVQSAGPRRLHMCFSPRKGREGSMCSRHPTMEQAIDIIRGNGFRR